MSIIWSIVWGLMALVIMLTTIKYYLPWLSRRAALGDSKAPADSQGKSKKAVWAGTYQCQSFLLKKKALRGLTVAGCTCITAWWGYAASIHAVSAVSMIKMTVAMGVFCCVFITDLELMMIPNLCCILLLAGRVITIVYEFIWKSGEAAPWLFNSIIAMLVSLVLLFVMSKVTHGGLGMGDVKLFASLGFLCGIRSVCFTLMLAFLLCAVASTGLLLTKKKQLKDSLPLGPFIWLGYGVTVLLAIM